MNYESIYDYFIEPEIVVEKLRRGRPWMFTFLVVFLALFTQGVSNLLFFLPGRTYALFSLTLFFLIRLVFIVFLWFLFSAFYHFSAELLGGEGKFTEIFLVLGFSFLPLFFLLPVSLSLRLLQTKSDFPFFLFYLAVNLLLIFWIVRLQILSIRRIYGLSVGKTFLVYFSPFLFFLSAITFLGTTLVLSIFLLLG